nr:immunoglobulin heavy chain junction region [Mus musculus]MBK4184998.1 immunoglobulin heavy chain junction region [Mus musculus]MBK4184999.1 immunoglobulin heavy chain junction region [Mus musculus]
CAREASYEGYAMDYW